MLSNKPFFKSLWSILICGLFGGTLVLYMSMGCSSDPDLDSKSSVHEQIVGSTELTRANEAQALAVQAAAEAAAAEAAAQAAAARAAALAAAQAIAASSSTPFVDPSSISSLALWLDASQSSTILDSGGGSISDGETVSEWGDRSSENNDATQGAGGNMPTYDVNEMGGNPAIVFSTDDYLSMTARAVNTSVGNLTFFAVMKSNAAGTEYLYSERTAIGYGYVLSFFTAGTNQSGSTIGSSADANTVLSGVDYRDNDPHIVTARSLSYQYQYIYRDGTEANDSDDTIADQGASSQIGEIGRFAGASYYNGSVSEIIIYRASLADSDRQNVECYLANKWSITVPHSC